MPHKVSAGKGGVATGGDIIGSALAPNSQANYVEHLHVAIRHREVEWPVVIGTLPTLASAFQPRTGLRDQIARALGSGDTVVLASGSAEPELAAGDAKGLQVPTQVMSGGGGVGKSQLAAAFARDAIRDGTDLVLWTSASDVQQVITAYAQAALSVQAPASTGQDQLSDAQAFLTWLCGTDRRWLVVLDDITDPAGMDGWWPDSPRANGWTLATTRLKDPRLTGGGRARIDVDVYSQAEATDYLTARLAHDGKEHLIDDQVSALVGALGYLPLALGHAAVYMIREEITCRPYLERFTDRAARLDELLPRWADTERYGRQITTTLLLALDATDRDPLGPLARAALLVSAVLDPAGHPAALWNTLALTAYLTDHRLAFSSGRAVTPVTGDEARAALRLLDRYGLITYYGSAVESRAVRIHALTARAVREAALEEHRTAVITAAADGLVAIWPNRDQTQRELASVLRANADAICTYAREVLQAPDFHPVLWCVGTSLLNAHLHRAAVAYWSALVADCERLLGNDHPDTLTARSNLAVDYWRAGRNDEAMVLMEQVLAAREQLLGNDHPNTLTARTNLAASYQTAGQTTAAITMKEQVVAESERLLGNDHPDTLIARNNLAVSYRVAGQTTEAIMMTEQLLVDCERLLGKGHPNTQAVRDNLAASYQEAGQTDKAIMLEEQVLAHCEQLLGHDHPDTLDARANLAASYWQAGRVDEAVGPLEQLVADSVQVLGGDHASTITARSNLAVFYSQAGRVPEAIDLQKRVVDDRERLLGRDHSDTLTARANLAVSYWRAGETGEAIAIEEQVVADYVRLLGSDHSDTLTARAELALSYHQAGRIREAISLQEQVVARRAQLLGHNHPDTVRSRNALSLWQSAVESPCQPPIRD
ncbi:tetratricopeptide repeat protein [Streptomyces sp. NPDC006235]|uniref:tetratricopeptide repeat protein n=1 Tax=Streptomyces sp. NPDC006235 TaxID=3156736 RepID=UPI0033ABCE8E